MKKTSYDQKLLNKIALEKEKRRAAETTGNYTSPNLKSISSALDHYYIVNKLRVYCTYLNYKNILNTKHLEYDENDFIFINEILNYIDKSNISLPTIRIYNQIRILLGFINIHNADMEELFFSTTVLVEENLALHDVDENLEMYSLLNNYCIRKINSGIQNYNKIFLKINCQILNLRKEANTKKTVTLQPQLFRNIVAAAVLIEDEHFFSTLQMSSIISKQAKTKFENRYEWTEAFIAIYHSKLSGGKLAEYYQQYCSALLEFCRGNYPKAYKIFDNSMRIQGTFLNLDMKILHLKILFETLIRKPSILEYDKIEIIQVLEAYRKLLRYETSKKCDITYHTPFYEHFEQCYKKLLQFYYKYEGRTDNARNENFKKRKKELRALIRKHTYSYTNWVLEKFNSIK